MFLWSLSRAQGWAQLVSDWIIWLGLRIEPLGRGWTQPGAALALSQAPACARGEQPLRRLPGLFFRLFALL